MNKIPLTEILKLTVAERLQLIEQIWDTIDTDSEDLPLADADRQELDRRLDAVDANPGVGRTWAEIETRLLAPG